MAGIRLIFLVVILGGLTLLLAQNFSPVISLVFLGLKTQSLPLAIWILFSATAGAFTSLLITAFLRLSSSFSRQKQTTAPKSPTTSPNPRATSREETTPPFNPPPAASQTEYTTSREFDDWETNPSENDDWDFEEKSETASSSKTYERQQTPKSSTESGSFYSYSYKEPKNTAVGKTESVYDADYRVIIPPYKTPSSNQTDDDDWGFFEDESSGNEEDQRPQR